MQKVERFLNTFVPNHYDLSFKLNRKQKLVEGITKITGMPKSDQINFTKRI